MFNVDFGDTSQEHVCIGHQEGDWIIFTCSKCNYQRYINWVTGEMRTNGLTTPIPHSGAHFPIIASKVIQHPN